jgi:hypothetical protein
MESKGMRTKANRKRTGRDKTLIKARIHKEHTQLKSPNSQEV